MYLFLSVLFLCSASTNGYNFFLNHPSSDLQKISTPENFARFVQDKLQETETRFLPSGLCVQHMLRYVGALLRLEGWALQMFDANAKIPAGLLNGNGGALGSFDECLKVESNRSETLNVTKGKYCLGRLQLLNLTNFQLSDSWSGRNGARLLDLSAETVSLPWGACLPEVCTPEDFRFFHIFLLRFSEDDCQTKESQIVDFDEGDIATLSIFGVIAAIIAASTAYDVIVYYGRAEPGNRLLRSFSFFTNGLKIVSLQEKDEISCIYGLRVLSMIAIMIGMRYITFVLAPLQNWIDLLLWITDKNKAFVLDAHICLDTFIFLTGFCVSFNYLKALDRGEKFNVLVYYLNRILRLTPALAAAILFHATLLRHVGSGPVWPQMRANMLVDNCREYWWSSILYVQNYVNPGLTAVCIMQSWQLCVDMHLFLLSPLILIPLKRWPKCTLAIVGVLLFCSIVSTFLSAWVYELKAVFVTNLGLADLDHYFNNFFFPTHTRASPWIIGIITGCVIHQLKKGDLKIPIKGTSFKLIALICWAISLAGIAMSIAVGRELIGVPYDWVPHAFHLALIRPLWAISIAWIVFACFSGHGGPINTFLSCSLFQVLSRITYCTYLMNVTIMFLVTYQTRVGLMFSDSEVFYRVLGDIPFSLAVGLVWTLAFESPMIAIANVMFGKKEDDIMLRLKRKDESKIP